MNTPNMRNSIRSLVSIPLILACFGLSPTVQAGTSLGAGNTADGAGALQSLTTGIHNTAEGYQSLFSDTTNSYNTATGSQALKSNTADNNTADGFQALLKNTIGDNNVATGWRALFSNTTGVHNTATGSQALYSNTTGVANAANGFAALFSNTIGHDNTANGVAALRKNTTGADNTADGVTALFSNTTGSWNIAIGVGAGMNLTIGDNNIDIGNIGGAGEANFIRIGTEIAVTDIFGRTHPAHTATYIAGISGVTLPSGAPVVVDTDGRLGVAATSSARFKDEIKPMDKASEAILALKPVTFRYKKEIDRRGTPQFGLVAEEVEKVNPDLVTHGADGKLYTVRYDAVNAMLLNEFLKERRKVQELKSIVAKQEAMIAHQQKDFQATAAQQQKEIRGLAASLKEQALQIQKVSSQLEVNNSAPRIAVSTP
jgi:Chaperone of endosialidase